MSNLSLHQMGCIGGELDPTLGVVEIDRIDQPHGALLEEVVMRLPQAGELPGRGLGQVEMLGYELIP